MDIAKLLEVVDEQLGQVMMVLILGVGIFLTVKLKFRPQRNLCYAIKSTLSKEARKKTEGEGDVSPFAALTTALAATIGTGNIVGVATAMVSGGPGALVWMWVSAFLGLSSKFSECMLAIKYREKNEDGEMAGGPMYTMKNGFQNKKVGAALGMAFAIFAVMASLGIGNMTQANSISSAMNNTFNIPVEAVAVVLSVLTLMIIFGGIQTISKVASVIVPVMAVFYILAGLLVIVINYKNVPSGTWMILKMAFQPQSVTGGVLGTIVASMTRAMRFGVARGIFSNEAGLGSAAITAAAVTTKEPVKQGYINMTGTFWDTIVVCTITGLCIASSGVLGMTDSSGELIKGAPLTIAAFSSALGSGGKILVTIGISFFAFSTILGWEYNGEKAIEYILGTDRYHMVYRIFFACIVFVGATTALDVVWNFSDIANYLMAIPNLISLVVLSGVIKKEVERFQPILENEKKK
ncbi:MAG: alanine:cation symporter family protein [Eubacterium sp.]|nr:alanine:cation symporter family protein [Eubacterium sp.]